MGFFSGLTKTIGRGLGDIFTGGLAETNFGGGLFRRLGNTVGGTLTANPRANLYGQNAATATGSPIQRLPIPAASTSDANLAALFAPVLAQAKAQADDTRAQGMQRLRASQAARGILRSGVSDYGASQLDRAAGLTSGQASSNLAQILGQNAAQKNLLGEQARLSSLQSADDHERNLQLARLVGEMNKPSELQQLLGVAQTGAQFLPFLL